MPPAPPIPARASSAPLASSEYSTATSLVANTNMLINTTSGSLTSQDTVAPNSLTFDNSTSICDGRRPELTLSSGGILVRNGVTSTIGGGIVTSPAGQLRAGASTPSARPP